jgi:uncharacterized membrane protein SpoIIM required for sporulation
MDYARYVATRRAEWRAAQVELDALGKAGLRPLDFDALEAFVARHRSLAAELGVVQARWPNTEAEATLRRLVLHGHAAIVPPAPPLLARARRFFAEEYPEIYRRCSPSLRLAGLVFLGGVWLGFVLTTLDDGMAALFVAPEAHDMIRRGVIWTDSLEGGPWMAARIFVNNILVALFAWAGGVFCGLLSTIALLRNGAMVGSIIADCLRYGIADRLFAFIPAHGMLELFLITVAGGAGYELARGVLGDGEGSRSARFAAAAGRSAALVGGTIPWFVLLGTIEGFLSPQMGFPTSAKFVVGAGILAIFLLYVRLRPRPA